MSCKTILRGDLVRCAVLSPDDVHLVVTSTPNISGFRTVRILSPDGKVRPEYPGFLKKVNKVSYYDSVI